MPINCYSRNTIKSVVYSLIFKAKSCCSSLKFGNKRIISLTFIVVATFIFINILTYSKLSDGSILTSFSPKSRFRHPDAFKTSISLSEVSEMLDEVNKKFNEIIQVGDRLYKFIRNLRCFSRKHGTVSYTWMIPSNETMIARLEKIRSMMKHAWSGYHANVFGANEYMPISNKQFASKIFGHRHIGVTILDSIDTLYIMGLKEEYNQAYEWIEKKLNFNVSTYVSVFESNIRFLGGLLSMYSFTKDFLFLKHAVNLANRLLPAFNSAVGVPFAFVDLSAGKRLNHRWIGSRSSVLAEVGTLHMEFTYLSEITGNPIYRNKVMRARHVLKNEPRVGGLYPVYISPNKRGTRSTGGSLGGLSDSFYEYLLKEWLRNGDLEAKAMYYDALSGIKKHLIRRSRAGMIYLGSYGRSSNIMEHLACFAGGMFALGAVHDSDAQRKSEFLEYAKNVTATCHESYEKSDTKLGPERFIFKDGVEAVATGRQMDQAYLLRPETFESYFYLWRLTKDPKYREWAWQGAQAIEKYCRTENGYSGLKNVYSVQPKYDDVQQSYFLAETLKYLFLIFCDDNFLPLDIWVFNTEAHPLPMLPTYYYRRAIGDLP